MPSSTQSRKTLVSKGIRDIEKAVRAGLGDRGNTLPWRRTHDPYAIFVSEIMLQQTGVERVIGKYETFLRTFPSWKKLAGASLEEVLTLWVGLGYNRRARSLHEAARAVSGRRGGFPKDPAHIEELPGAGSYTAAAVATFAFNTPTVFIETNIRTVFLYHCFQGKKNVHDSAILPLVARSLRGKNPRRWYTALMDYGAYLKKQGVRVNTKSAHYTKQNKFEGSARQLRGAIIRLYVAGEPLTPSVIAKRFGKKRRQVEREIGRLTREGLLSGNR